MFSHAHEKDSVKLPQTAKTPPKRSFIAKVACKFDDAVTEAFVKMTTRASATSDTRSVDAGSVAKGGLEVEAEEPVEEEKPMEKSARALLLEMLALHLLSKTDASVTPSMAESIANESVQDIPARWAVSTSSCGGNDAEAEEPAEEEKPVEESFGALLLEISALHILALRD